MSDGERFSFLCIPKMAEKMDRIVRLNGGEIVERETKNYGVLLSVEKNSR